MSTPSKSWREILTDAISTFLAWLAVLASVHWFWPGIPRTEPPPDASTSSSPADEPDQVKTGRKYQIDSHTWATTALIDGRVYLVIWNDAGHSVSAVAVGKRENVGTIQ